jgi:hypothetical protein
MKNFKIILSAFLMLPLLVLAQEKDKDSIIDKPERPAFESATLIDNATNVLFSKNTLEIQMQHRFGPIDDENSLLGIYGPANIRIGLSYAILDRLTVGYGITKTNRLHDFSWKAALLRQTRSDKTPVSVTYYGNFTIDGRSGDANDDKFILRQDRYSNFHQLIIARRFSPKFSLQIAPSISHYNTVDFGRENDRFAIAFGGRAKISPQTSILFDYSQPITQFDDVIKLDDSVENYNHPGISLGVEFSTSAHAFQLFLTNYNGIVPQQNYMKNTSDFFDKGILIGFNITRNYNF